MKDFFESSKLVLTCVRERNGGDITILHLGVDLNDFEGYEPMFWDGKSK